MTAVAAMSIAVTGGSGRVGTALRRVLAPDVREIRVLDVAAPAELAANETFRRADITDLDALAEAVRGVDGIVHLAGFPNERPLADIVAVNVVGSSTLYEAARLAGVGRVVLGSSNHVAGFYPRSTRVGPDAPMRPDGLYGLSKCWAELTAGLYFDKCGIRSLIVRIGNAQARPTTPRSLEIWLSPGDLAQLVVIGMIHPAIDCTTVWGVSAGGGSWWDNAAAEALGYTPRDVIRDFADPDAWTPQASAAPEITEYFQGAQFCARGHDGVVRRRRGDG